MKCNRCKTGRVFLDRVFSDNVGLETFCLHCGDRKYLRRGSDLGKLLGAQEKNLDRLRNGLTTE